jgi:hypothetical protein
VSLRLPHPGWHVVCQIHSVHLAAAAAIRLAHALFVHPRMRRKVGPPARRGAGRSPGCHHRLRPQSTAYVEGQQWHWAVACGPESPTSASELTPDCVLAYHGRCLEVRSVPDCHVTGCPHNRCSCCASRSGLSRGTRTRSPWSGQACHAAPPRPCLQALPARWAAARRPPHLRHR